MRVPPHADSLSLAPTSTTTPIGKTSLIGMLTGVTTPSEGDALVNGFSVVHDRSGVLQSTGFCPQFGGLWPTLTLREHLELFAGLRGFDAPKGVAAVVQEIETTLNVAEHANKLVQELSGGTQVCFEH